jgi:adenine-specific DNA-methyltransferase
MNTKPSEGMNREMLNEQPAVDGIEKIAKETPDLTEENVQKLIELFPDVATEVRDPVTGEVVKGVNPEALLDRIGKTAGGGYPVARERYQFTWPGKRAAKAEARTPIAKTLRPVQQRSKNWDETKNLYIEGDNLDALKILRETYAGKIKMIYIDPPYNTGHDFIYKDDFAKTVDADKAESGDYDEDGGRLVANPESNGRFHSDWCSMMYSRLLLAKDLLTSDGVIFISIDDNESAGLRFICDEVFGSLCFVGDVSWQRTYSPRNDSQGLVNEVEHIIVYSKNPGWQPKTLSRTAQMDAKYKNPDKDYIEWTSSDPFAPNAVTHQGMVYAVQHPFTGAMIYPTNGRCWSFEQPQMLQYMNGWCEYELKDIDDAEQRAKVCGIASSEVRAGVKALVLIKPLDVSKAEAQVVYDRGHWPRFYFTRGGQGGIRRKTYLDSVGGKLPTNLWPYSEVGHTDEAKKEIKALFDGQPPFDTPKPVRLITRMLNIATDKDSLILDFFSGSSTTAHAVIAKNADDHGARRFILVQLPERTSGDYTDICEVGEDRIRRAGEKIRSNIETTNQQPNLDGKQQAVPDIGFRVLRIESSNYKDVRLTPDQFTQDDLDASIENEKQGRTPLDLLFEALPSFQLEYSSSIATLTGEPFDGYTVFSVNDGQLLACFDANIPESLVRAMANHDPRPSYVVVAEKSLPNSAARTNFEEIFKQAANAIDGATKIRII